jgi:hypothetical protein
METIEKGLYRVNRSYIRYLRERDPNVCPPECNLYCGPVFTVEEERGTLYFFTPATDKPLPYDNYLQNRYWGGRIGCFDVAKMIPVPPECLTSVVGDEQFQKAYNYLHTLLEGAALERIRAEYDSDKR